MMVRFLRRNSFCRATVSLSSSRVLSYTRKDKGFHLIKFYYYYYHYLFIYVFYFSNSLCDLWLALLGTATVNPINIMAGRVHAMQKRQEKKSKQLPSPNPICCKHTGPCPTIFQVKIGIESYQVPSSEQTTTKDNK